MGERTVNWLVYTCLIGLVPVISRAFIWSVSKSGIEPLAISDLVAFGLVLHASNIHEINSEKETNSKWKIVHNGFSVLFLVIYSLILTTTIATMENLNIDSIRNSTIFLCVVSFLLSFSIFYRKRTEERIVRERKEGVA